MDKDEILKRAQERKVDEGMEYVENKGRRIGFTIFCLVFVFIVIFDAALGLKDSTTFHAASAMFWAFLAAEAYPKYQFTHRKVYLVTVIAGGIASLASLANFIINRLG